MTRRATAADAAELVRLRAVMLAALGRETDDDGWRAAATETLRARLAAPDSALAAFVVVRPDRPGALASCAVGVVDYRIGGPGNHTGEAGYILSVATDPDQRRRGYSRRCVTALIDWYRSRGITRIDLRASDDGEPLYRALGFARSVSPMMRLQLD